LINPSSGLLRFLSPRGWPRYLLGITTNIQLGTELVVCKLLLT